MASCEIEVLSHSFIIKEIDPRFVPIINGFARPFVSTKRERMGRHFVEVPDKVYAWANKTRTEFRFHRNQLDDFLAHMSRYGHSKPPIVHRELYKPAETSIKLPSSWKPRENQIPIIEYALAEGASKVITLQTGQGKTSISLKIGEELGARAMVLVLGRYFDKWKGDIKEQYRLKANEVMAVRGAKQLFGFMEELHRNPKMKLPKVFIVTLGTMRGYIDEYSALGDDIPEWFIPPDRLWERLGIGYRITDEVHQHFHANYVIELFTHIPKAVYLSATMVADHELANKMAAIAFPLSNRKSGGAFIKISDVISVHYGLEEPEKARYTGFASSYNHTVYEEYLLGQPKKLRRHHDMVYSLIKEYHFPRVKEGHRLLIFAATVEMCLSLVEYLTDRVEDLRVCKYTAEDPLDIIEQHDITVTTIGSAGTALDIAGLITCIMTTSINSRQANEQALGRLRDLRTPGLTPLFIYLVCDHIPKQMEYHLRKKDTIFNGKALSFRSVRYEPKI